MRFAVLHLRQVSANLPLLSVADEVQLVKSPGDSDEKGRDVGQDGSAWEIYAVGGQLCDDFFDLDFDVPLAMAYLSAVAFAAFELDHVDLGAFDLGVADVRNYFGALD